MLSSLYEGIGPIVAPEINNNMPEPKKEAALSFFDRVFLAVAPDPKYQQRLLSEEDTDSDKTNENNNTTNENNNNTTNETVVLTSESSTPPPQPATRVPPPDAFQQLDYTLCQHCNKVTPVRRSGPPTPPPPPPPDEPTSTGRIDPQTPANNNSYGHQAQQMTPDRNEIDKEVMHLVMEAALATARDGSSKYRREHIGRIMRICGSDGKDPLDPKVAKKLKRLLQGKFIKGRAVGLGEMAPNGYTPLMTAANKNNVGAARVILEIDPTATKDRDFEGRSALHICSELGHTEMIAFLLGHDGGTFGADQIDLTGRTPLGRALTSPNPKAKRNKASVQKALFSPEDRSIRGKPIPAMNREMAHLSMDLAYSEADMPGYRVVMEDFKISRYWRNQAGEEFCLLGVCDGHSDDGDVSKYVAENVASILYEKTMQISTYNWHELFTDICLEVDSNLKDAGLVGGSTGVFALVRKDEIIVANVGDSRCILVQNHPATSQESDSSAPPLVEEADSGNGEQGGDGNNPESGTETAAGEDSAPKKEDVKTESATAEASSENRKDEKAATVDPCVVCPLSDDHKPDLEEERERIENAGMSVVEESFVDDNGKTMTIYKVKKNGSSMMAVSRAFGDFEYKKNAEKGPLEQAVVAVPEIRVHARDTDTDQFLVLACDGIWDVMTNEDVGKFVFDRYEKLPRDADRHPGMLSEMADALLEECFKRKSGDNLTLIVAALSKASIKFTGSISEVPRKALLFSSPPPGNKS